MVGMGMGQAFNTLKMSAEERRLRRESEEGEDEDEEASAWLAVRLQIRMHIILFKVFCHDHSQARCLARESGRSDSNLSRTDPVCCEESG